MRKRRGPREFLKCCRSTLLAECSNVLGQGRVCSGRLLAKDFCSSLANRSERMSISSSGGSVSVFHVGIGIRYIGRYY
jgi:hypothetical protein